MGFTIYEWLKVHRERGPEALKVQTAADSSPKLTERQMAQLHGITYHRKGSAPART